MIKYKDYGSNNGNFGSEYSLFGSILRQGRQADEQDIQVMKIHGVA